VLALHFDLLFARPAPVIEEPIFIPNLTYLDTSSINQGESMTRSDIKVTLEAVEVGLSCHNSWADAANLICKVNEE